MLTTLVPVRSEEAPRKGVRAFLFPGTFKLYADLEGIMKHLAHGNTGLMTTDQLAGYLSVSPRTVRRMRQAGELPAIRVRSLWRYDPDVVVRALMTRGLHE